MSFQKGVDIFAYLCKYVFVKTNKCCFKFELDKLTGLFKALSDKNRLSIFRHICENLSKGSSDANVMDLSSCCNVDLSVVSRHLQQLKQAGVLKAEKKGKEVFYSLNSAEVASFLRSLADYIDECGEACAPTIKPEKAGRRRV